MKSQEVTIARIYITEASGLLKSLLKYLQHDAKLRGVTVFRALEGFGGTGEQSAALVDLSLSLPLVIEFFDEPNKIAEVLDHLSQTIKAGHIVSWSAQVNM